MPPALDAPILPNISRYSCEICGERYSQRQGVSRHRRSAHNSPHSCLFCEHTWTRPDQYRNHLKRCHPEINPNTVLGKPAGSRGRSMIIGRDLPPGPQHLPPPAIGPDGQSHAEPLQPPILLPPLAMSPVALAHGQPGHAGLAAMAYRPGDALGLGLLGAGAPSVFPSPSLGELAQLQNNLDFITQSWLSSAYPGGSAADGPSNPVMPLIPPIAPPAGEYYGSPAFVEPMVEQSLMDSYPSSVGDDDTGTNTFTP